MNEEQYVMTKAQFEDQLVLAKLRGEEEGRRDEKLHMLCKIADALSNEQFNFPGFTGDNLEWVFHEIGLQINHKQKGKRFIVTEEDSCKYRFNQYDRPVVGDMVEIICPSIRATIDGKPVTIVDPYIKKV